MRVVKVVVRPSPNETKIRVTQNGQQVLTAHLAASPWHRRALPTLLEGLALWQGPRVQAVIAAVDGAHYCGTVICDGDFAELAASPLYDLERALTPKIQREVPR